MRARLSFLQRKANFLKEKWRSHNGPLLANSDWCADSTGIVHQSHVKEVKEDSPEESRLQHNMDLNQNNYVNALALHHLADSD